MSFDVVSYLEGCYSLPPLEPNLRGDRRGNLDVKKFLVEIFSKRFSEVTLLSSKCNIPYGVAEAVVLNQHCSKRSPLYEEIIRQMKEVSGKEETPQGVVSKYRFYH